MRVSHIIFATALSALVVAEPAPASACSCFATSIWRSIPLEGASDVALNHALVVEGFLDASAITLESADGTKVEFDLDVGPTPGCAGTWAELLPRALLAPMTQYTVRVKAATGRGTDPDRTALTFTTGTQVLPEQDLTTPKARATVVEGLPQSGASCGPTTTKAYVHLEDSTDVEMVARRGDEIIMRWLFSEDARDGDFGFGIAPDCLEFRRRAATGQRSAPLTLCGDALRSPENDAAAPESENDGGAIDTESQSAADAAAEVSNEGCSAGPRARTSEVASALLLLIMASGVRAARRRASTARR